MLHLDIKKNNVSEISLEDFKGSEILLKIAKFTHAWVTEQKFDKTKHDSILQFLYNIILKNSKSDMTEHDIFAAIRVNYKLSATSLSITPIPKYFRDFSKHFFPTQHPDKKNSRNLQISYREKSQHYISFFKWPSDSEIAERTSHQAELSKPCIGT